MMSRDLIQIPFTIHYKTIAIELTTNTLSAWSIILPAVCGLATLGSLSYRAKIIFTMIIFAVVPHSAYLFPEYLTDILALNDIPKEYLQYTTYNFNIYIEFVCLYLYFESLIEKDVRLKFRFLYVLALFSGIAMIIDQGNIYSDFISKWLVINNLLYCGSILYILLKMYSDDAPLKIEPSFFIFMIALFLYTSGTVIYFSFQDKATALKVIHDLLNITLYALIALGFIREYVFSKKNYGF